MVRDIWNSFRRLPGWVQVWVGLILVPVNCLPLLFLDAHLGVWVAAFSIGGMLPNLPIMVRDRGLSKRMALPHVVIWPSVVILAA